jgi:xanthine phosphoribosyltransferase
MLQSLKQKILEKGIVINEEILSVDSFLNHQLDINLCLEIGETFASYFKSLKPTLILTAESSGIVPAFTTAKELGIPIIVVRKAPSVIMQEKYISTSSFSFTRKSSINLFLNKDYVKPHDRILIIDDFLSNGDLSQSLLKLIAEIKAHAVGAGFVIEKSFLPGRKLLETQHPHLKILSLAKIASLENKTITFGAKDS